MSGVCLLVRGHVCLLGMSEPQMVPRVISSVIPHVVQVFADVAKRYLHEVAAVRQQGSASTSGSSGNRVNLVQRRSQSFFRDEVPQDPAGQVS